MKHILYTVQEGGRFLYISFMDDEETTKKFNIAKKSGELVFKHEDMEVVIEPAYIALLEDIDNFDFIINKKR